jgi:hypothetical protein
MSALRCTGYALNLAVTYPPHSSLARFKILKYGADQPSKKFKMSQNGSNSAISRLFFLTPWSYSKEFLRAKTPPRVLTRWTICPHILPILRERAAHMPYQYLESFYSHIHYIGRALFHCSIGADSLLNQALSRMVAIWVTASVVLI